MRTPHPWLGSRIVAGPMTDRVAGRSISTVAIVVPAHDEEQLVGRCLASLRHAAAHLATACANPPEVRIIVVLDACTDGTAAAVAAEPAVRRVVVDHRRVGAARRAGALAALDAPGGHRCWLASTDADSVVPRDWLSAMVAFARAGADLVLGTVVPDVGLPRATRERWRRDYRSGDRHPHVHGANLGIRASSYHALGGWPPAACHEDVALVARAVAAGMSIVRTGAIPVRTSSRLTGRAPHGFAAYLAALTR